MRYCIIYILILILPFSCLANRHKKEIRTCFENYKTAVIKNDGKTALKHVSSSTINLYKDIIDWALHADSITVNAMTVMNKVSVLALRAEKEKEDLTGVSSEMFFVEAVEKEKVDKIWMNKFELNEIAIDDNNAQASLLFDGEEIAFTFRFIYEKESWRFDLLSFFKINEYLVRNDIQTSGKTENQYIFDLLKPSYNNLSESVIWQPLE